MNEQDKELIDRLRNYNAWRRDEGNASMPDPKRLGRDIDEAIILLEERAALAHRDASQQAEIDRLKAWKESAESIEQEWDVQAIASLIGVPLGGGIRSAIQPYIEEQQAEIDRLKAELGASRTLMAYIYFLAYHHGHEDTVEARYTDVYHADSWTYWLEEVDEVRQDEATAALAQQHAALAKQGGE